ncbi:MAG: DEAD/DEAH box helicase, partial [Phycisphaerales bacterium]|nr:DEAD/DEAH box helicase [Phycisphaerales bacterium]
HLHLWAESLERFNLRSQRSVSSASHFQNGIDQKEGSCVVATTPTTHPFCESSATLSASLQEIGIDLGEYKEETLLLNLPHDLLGPWPSERLVSIIGDYEHDGSPLLTECRVPTIAIPPARAVHLLAELIRAARKHTIEIEHSVRFWTSVARFSLDLLVDQRFIPTFQQVDRKHLSGKWTPWLHDEEIVNRFGKLLVAMPPAARSTGIDGQPLLERALEDMTDGLVRDALVEDDFIDAIEDWNPSEDALVSWLTALLHRNTAVPGDPDRLLNIFTDGRRWLGRLCDIGEDLSWHLLFDLSEPHEHRDHWLLRFSLRSAEDDSREVSAEEIWAEAGGEHAGDDRLPELLLGELDRASLLYSKLELCLGESTPTELKLTTNEAHQFLVEYTPLLEESGFLVATPTWWGNEQSRLSASLHIEAESMDEVMAARLDGPSTDSSMLGLHAIVECSWKVAVGGQVLSQEEFEQLISQDQSLVKINGRWVHLQDGAIDEARRLFADGATTKMPLVEALRLIQDDDDSTRALEISGMSATGWVKELLDSTTDNATLPEIEQPPLFEGQLRPYQLTGLRWLAFLSRFGIGACLADDMGLGKTIQLIALLQHERADECIAVGQTLLIVPTSVVGNWYRELDKFSPEIRVHIHHGPDRPLGDDFKEAIADCDVVITTYGLVHRDRETLGTITWHRVCLDEAQYIKNPPTKQAQSIRNLNAWHRVALTGTPVENRLIELWSIMEFLNPGYLGPASKFRRSVARPIEQRRDPRKADRLRQMIQPFVLRRLKTDATVIDDLPECVQTKEYATLTREQAGLYEHVVGKMIGEVERSDGIQRRGLVLSTLVKLKQICNHPGHYSQAGHLDGAPSVEISAPGLQTQRSGKANRLMSLLEEVLATGEKALVFTQFREMGRLLSAMIQHDLDCETMFLHGGTPTRRRQQF